MKKKVQLPAYISIEQYSVINNTEHLSDLERVIKIISRITETDEEEIRRWNINSLKEVFNGMQENLFDYTPMLLPIIEFNHTIWGLQPISKMSVGEYIDFENILKTGDLAELMAILYRPIVRNDLGGLEWKIRMNLKYVMGKTENLFKYYDIEKYDNTKRTQRKEILKHLPIQLAMGALDFFLSIGIQSQANIILSSPNLTEMEKEVMRQEMKIMDQLSTNFGVGSEYWPN